MHCFNVVNSNAQTATIAMLFCKPMTKSRFVSMCTGTLPHLLDCAQRIGCLLGACGSVEHALNIARHRLIAPSLIVLQCIADFLLCLLIGDF